MGKTIDNRIKEHIKKILLGANIKPKELSKLAILSDKFYKDNKEAFDLANVRLSARKVMMSNFILFIVQFETVCIKAYKLSGSGSTADDIIHLYSSKERLRPTDIKNEGAYDGDLKTFSEPISNKPFILKIVKPKSN
jgi:hypothetical protein